MAVWEPPLLWPLAQAIRKEPQDTLFQTSAAQPSWEAEDGPLVWGEACAVTPLAGPICSEGTPPSTAAVRLRREFTSDGKGRGGEPQEGQKWWRWGPPGQLAFWTIPT